MNRQAQRIMEGRAPTRSGSRRPQSRTAERIAQVNRMATHSPSAKRGSQSSCARHARRVERLSTHFGSSRVISARSYARIPGNSSGTISEKSIKTASSASTRLPDLVRAAAPLTSVRFVHEFSRCSERRTWEWRVGWRVAVWWKDGLVSVLSGSEHLRGEKRRRHGWTRPDREF